jgi:alkyl hydroperoxide reductase subunit AhpC
MPSSPMSLSAMQMFPTLDTVQLTAKHKVAAPVNWKNGDDVKISDVPQPPANHYTRYFLYSYIYKKHKLRD